MSVRLRLTLLYTAVLAVTLLVFGLILYFRLDHTLHTEIDSSLRTRADQDVRLLNGPPRGGEPNNGSPPPSGVRGIRVAELTALAVGDPNIYRQVLDGGGNACSVPPAASGASLPRPSSAANEHFETATTNHVHLRMLVRPLPADVTFRGLPGCAPPLTELLARPLTDVDNILGRLQFVLLVGTAVSLIVAGGAGWLLARNALRPIDRLTAEASAIGRRQDFKRRVEHQGPDDEVGRLATTFNTMLDSLDAAHERLRRALEAQRRFVADASHELRTPLTTIRGNVELLRLEDAAMAPDQQEALDDIFTESERMGRLVNNLLALARADSGLRISQRPVEVQPVVAEVFQKAARLAGGVDLRLGETVAASVLGDRDYLVQLLFILVDNALKYTPAGGVVAVSSHVAGSSLRIAVSDTGIGIALQDQARVFDRFYRADPSRHGESTGLGLSIARWIAQELGGAIELQSRPGKGSTFTVVLPVLPSAVQPGQPAAAVATGD